MMRVPALKVIGNDPLPEYPIPRGERLASHSFFLFHFDRWLNSDLYLLGDWDVKGIAHALWCLSQNQDPVGTLPDSPRLIAALLHMSTDHWEAYTRRDPSPLHGWHRCMVGEDVRLMHDVVTEVALAALGQRAKTADRQSADSERKRMQRLRETVMKLNLRHLAENEMFIAQLDRALEQRFPGGSRTTPRILEVMEVDLQVRDARR